MSNKPNGRMHGVAHHIPHRTRYHLATHHRNAETKNRVHELLNKVPGVKKVEFNERTGSVLVHHDEVPEILGALSEALTTLGADLFEEIASEEMAIIPGVSLAAHLVKNRFSKVDRYLARITNNYVDLKILLPLIFLGAGLYQVSKRRMLFESVPPLVLFYYAYDSYLKFHGPSVDKSLHGNGHQFN